MLTYALLMASLAGFQDVGAVDEGFSRYENAGFHFFVNMIGTPQVENDTMTTPAGELPVLSVSSTDGERSYTIVSTEYPETLAAREPDDIFDGIQKGAISQGKLVRQRSASLDGYPGRDVEYEWPEGGATDGATYYRERMYMVGNRIYRAIYASLRPDTAASHVDEWLNSFGLDFKNGPKPPMTGQRPDSRAVLAARLLNAAIPFLAGIYATLLGHRKIGKQPGESLPYDLWHQKWGRILRLLGPILVLGGLFIGFTSVHGL